MHARRAVGGSDPGDELPQLRAHHPQVKVVGLFLDKKVKGSSYGAVVLQKVRRIFKLAKANTIS